MVNIGFITVYLNDSILNKSSVRFEQMLTMGFKGGFIMTLNYLEKLLAALSK